MPIELSADERRGPLQTLLQTLQEELGGLEADGG
jgi:hypothetical protein